MVNLSSSHIYLRCAYTYHNHSHKTSKTPSTHSSHHLTFLLPIHANSLGPPTHSPLALNLTPFHFLIPDGVLALRNVISNSSSSISANPSSSCNSGCCWMSSSASNSNGSVTNGKGEGRMRRHWEEDEIISSTRVEMSFMWEVQDWSWTFS